MRTAFKLAVLWFGFAQFGPAAVYAQIELTEYLDKEVAAVAVISEPRNVFDHTLELLGLNDEDWATVLRLATDESFGIAHIERIDSIKESALDVQSLLKNVEEIGVVLHSLQDRDISIVIKVDPSIHKELSACCGKIVRDIINVDKPPMNDQDQFDSTDVGCFFQSIGEWIVISNSNKCGAELVERIGGKPIAKRDILRQTRKYKRVALAFGKPSKEEGSIAFYGSPEKLSPLFYPELTDAVRQAYRFNEIPAIGLRVEFDAKEKNASEPILSFDFVVPFTEPRIGFGALIAAYKPIGDLPRIPFDVTDLNAYAFDPVKLHEVTREIMDEANGKGEYEKSNQERAQRYSRNFLGDEMPRMNRFIRYRFVDKDVRRLIAISMEGVHDFDAMNRFVEAYLTTINDLNRQEEGGDLYKELPNEYGLMKAKRARNKYERQTAFFLNKDWSISGDLNNIEQLLGALYGNTTSSEVCRAIVKTRKEMGGNSDVFRIQFFSFWNFKPETYEMDRIRQKYNNNKKKASEVLNGPKNGDGYQLEIENQDDCKAVVITLVGRSLARRLGSALFLYFNEDGRLRVKGGLFPGFNFHYMNRDSNPG